jgi:flap endonuclease-1
VVLSIIRSFLKSGFTPIFVFDGPPESLKRPTNPQLISEAKDAYDRYSKRQDLYDTRLAHNLWESRPLRWYFAVLHIKDLCSSIGIPSFTAPSEAEMMAAAICREGLSGSVLSNDIDTLLFGSPNISRALKMSSGQIESATLGHVMQEVGINLTLLRDLAIVTGCDFHQGIKGIGVRKGVVLLQRFGGLEGILKARGFGISEREEFLTARRVLDEADHLSVNRVNSKLNAPMESRISELLLPIMGGESAEKQSREFVRIWKDFGKTQATLERWT